MCKVFFFVLLRSVGRRDLSAGPEQKKNTTQGVFFFAPAPGKGRARRSPVPTRGQSKKKKHHPGCFFLLRPRRKAREGEAPLGAGTGPEQKKKHHPGCFFLLRPRGKAGEGEAPLGAGTRPRPDRGGVFFFAVAPPGCSLTHCGLGRFRQGPGGVFFLLRPRRVFLDNSKKCLGYYIGSKKTRRGHSKKKNTTSP